MFNGFFLFGFAAGGKRSGCFRPDAGGWAIEDITEPYATVRFTSWQLVGKL